MRIINSKDIVENVKKMCMTANYELSPDILDKIKKAYQTEKSNIGKNVLKQLIENAKIACEEKKPICQDTGMAVFFITIGKDVHISGDNIQKAINKGVKEGYEEGYLRKSVVKDPIIRENTKDNTPAVIYYEYSDGDKIEINFSPKGFGSENMSALKMLKPADGEKGIVEFVVETVKNAGPNPCPPIVVGVGIGGTADKAAVLAKKALFRNTNLTNKKEHIQNMEKEILKRINNLGIGPAGTGGITTALAVNIETYPTHIAGLPVCVNLSCHATRHISVII